MKIRRIYPSIAYKGLKNVWDWNSPHSTFCSLKTLSNLFYTTPRSHPPHSISKWNISGEQDLARSVPHQIMLSLNCFRQLLMGWQQTKYSSNRSRIWNPPLKQYQSGKNFTITQILVKRLESEYSPLFYILMYLVTVGTENLRSVRFGRHKLCVPTIQLVTNQGIR